MDTYSYISENGTIREIADVAARTKNTEQDTRMAELETKLGEPSIQDYKTLMLLTPAGTASNVDYKYTATEDCFFALSQNWAGNYSEGFGAAVYLGTAEEKGVCVRIVPPVSKYGTGTRETDIINVPSIMTEPLFIKKNATVWYRWINYSNNSARNARVRIFVKRS